MLPAFSYPTNQVSGAVTIRLFTTTLTESASEPWAPVTVNSNVSVSSPAGAVNVGDATMALERATDVPAVWTQEYVSVPPAGSVLLEPSKVTTAAEESASKSSPATATGSTAVGVDP